MVRMDDHENKITTLFNEYVSNQSLENELNFYTKKETTQELEFQLARMIPRLEVMTEFEKRKEEIEALSKRLTNDYYFKEEVQDFINELERKNKKASIAMER